MPTIEVNNCNFYYEDVGEGLETIVFSHMLLLSNNVFAKQVEYLKDKYRVIAYDHRNHGDTEIIPDKIVTLDQSCDDLIEIIQGLELGPVHLVGQAMGGYVVSQVALKAPELVKSLVLISAGADSEPFLSYLKFIGLCYVAETIGVNSAVVAAAMPVFFGPQFLKDKLREDEKKYWKSEMLKNKPTVTRVVRGFMERKAVESELHKIECPTLIIVGEDSETQPVATSKILLKNIRNSDLHILKECGHTCTVEQPEEVNKLLGGFYNGLE